MAWTATYPQIWFTFGPQTKDREVLLGLFGAGATGVRLTFSYGTPDLQAERAALVRSVAQEIDKPVTIVADLQGEKCRLAKIEGIDEIPVSAGQTILLAADRYAADDKLFMLPVQNRGYLMNLIAGDIVIEGDGALELEVISIADNGLLCRSQQSGFLHPGRGLIVRGPEFRPAALTPKDETDLEYIASSDLFDVVALSFTASAADINHARAIIESKGNKSLSILAKIETQKGVERLDEISIAADALMAARGDLALTMPWPDLPLTVNKISQAAKRSGKPWILATQLAEGLERFVFPTRAEICDLAHWVQEGAFGAMASYETAFGSRPIDAICAIALIVSRYRS
ncbi:MAG TPA: pyruvate kinase [Thermoanaerobaculia bacterium]